MDSGKGPSVITGAPVPSDTTTRLLGSGQPLGVDQLAEPRARRCPLLELDVGRDVIRRPLPDRRDVDGAGVVLREEESHGWCLSLGGARMALHPEVGAGPQFSTSASGSIFQPKISGAVSTRRCP